MHEYFALKWLCKSNKQPYSHHFWNGLPFHLRKRCMSLSSQVNGLVREVNKKTARTNCSAVSILTMTNKWCSTELHWDIPDEKKRIQKMNTSQEFANCLKIDPFRAIQIHQRNDTKIRERSQCAQKRISCLNCRISFPPKKTTNVKERKREKQLILSTFVPCLILAWPGSQNYRSQWSTHTHSHLEERCFFHEVVTRYL